jgi:hypothetical protein
VNAPASHRPVRLPVLRDDDGPVEFYRPDRADYERYVRNGRPDVRGLCSGGGTIRCPWIGCGFHRFWFKHTVRRHPSHQEQSDGKPVRPLLEMTDDEVLSEIDSYPGGESCMLDVIDSRTDEHGQYRDMSESEVAKYFGITQSAVSQIEKKARATRERSFSDDGDELQMSLF